MIKNQTDFSRLAAPPLLHFESLLIRNQSDLFALAAFPSLLLFESNQLEFSPLAAFPFLLRLNQLLIRNQSEFFRLAAPLSVAVASATQFPKRASRLHVVVTLGKSHFHNCKDKRLA